MKPNRDASALAARLGAAANTPIPLPEPRPAPPLVQTIVTSEAAPAKPKRGRGHQGQKQQACRDTADHIAPASCVTEQVRSGSR